MSKDITGTCTEQNLWAAFNGESAARAKYQLYAMQARIDGLHEIGAILEETADNELQHAKLWLRALNQLGQTDENIQVAQKAERFEWTHMYAEFERVAREEGFSDIADQFQRAAEVEHRHEKRFAEYIKRLENQQMFHKPKSESWVCGNCGYPYIGGSAPDTCPLCKHSRGWFMVEPN